MQVDFSNNYFELFEVPVGFDLQQDHLDARYRALQSYLHPDKFAASADAERRWSMQAASFVNEAYQTLSKPLKRAAYMLSLNGISIDEETDTQMSPAFLMEQMEHREALAEAPAASDPYDALDKIASELNKGFQSSAVSFKAAAEKEDWTEARTVVRQWQFLEKLFSELKTTEARLDESL